MVVTFGSNSEIDMRVTIIGENEAGQRLDKYLTKYMKDAPMSFIYKMLRKKNIVLNHKKSTGRELLKIGDEVSFFLSDETIVSFQPENNQKDAFLLENKNYINVYHKFIDIVVIYEDEDILIADKPVGILSQKAASDDISINDWLIGYLLEHKCITPDSLQTFRPSICNRLDRNTSGMIVCSKSFRASRVLNEMFANRTIEKYYRCLAQGSCTIEGVITSYLYKDREKNKVYIYQEEKEIPKQFLAKAVFIKTGIRKISENNGITELEITLFTGKSHQIRAQLSALGMPLVGDAKYGKNMQGAGQLLHCSRLQFPSEVPELPQLSGKIFTSNPSWIKGLTNQK